MSEIFCTFRILDEPGPGDALHLARDFERRHRVLLTVHDLAQVLPRTGDAAALPDHYYAHRHPVCTRDRTDPHIEGRCLAHCWKAANDFATRRGVAFDHRCWRGQREIVVPVFHGEIHCMSLFVNPFGKGKASSSRRWPRAERVRRLASEAQAIGQQFIRLAEQAEGLTVDNARKATIQRLLAFHAHREAGRDAAAKALGVSPSRASHIIKELFGKPWRELLVDSRIERARRLLRQEGLTVTEVALLCGYEDPNTFCRIFRKRVGTSPGRWRRRPG
jgi:AraC-like DNA-binding protein